MSQSQTSVVSTSAPASAPAPATAKRNRLKKTVFVLLLVLLGAGTFGGYREYKKYFPNGIQPPLVSQAPEQTVTDRKAVQPSQARVAPAASVSLDSDIVARHDAAAKVLLEKQEALHQASDRIAKAESKASHALRIKEEANANVARLSKALGGLAGLARAEANVELAKAQLDLVKAEQAFDAAQKFVEETRKKVVLKPLEEAIAKAQVDKDAAYAALRTEQERIERARMPFESFVRQEAAEAAQHRSRQQEIWAEEKAYREAQMRFNEAFLKAVGDKNVAKKK